MQAFTKEIKGLHLRELLEVLLVARLHQHTFAASLIARARELEEEMETSLPDLMGSGLLVVQLLLACCLRGG